VGEGGTPSPVIHIISIKFSLLIHDSPTVLTPPEQDVGRSSSLDEACKVMQLSGVVRLAIRLVKGLEIKIADSKTQSGKTGSLLAAGAMIPVAHSTQQGCCENFSTDASQDYSTQAQPSFEMAVFSAIPWFKVRQGIRVLPL
jgi:hypothetical protein